MFSSWNTPLDPNNNLQCIINFIYQNFLFKHNSGTVTVVKQNDEQCLRGLPLAALTPFYLAALGLCFLCRLYL